MENNKKICKHYIKGKCVKGDNCDFDHIPNICSHYFFGSCKFGDSCKLSHEFKLKSGNKDKKKNRKKLIKKNTETFEPFKESGDMRVMVGNGLAPKYNYEIKPRDVVLINNLFGPNESMDIYNKLLAEIKATGAEEKGLWKLWHGDSHLIADDHIQWKNKCPTFNSIIEKIKIYFDMDIKATRLNWYKDADQFKPYHHDAAAVDPNKASTQNFTVGISFGATRTASFQHVDSRTVIDFPLVNGMTYCFADKTNVEWRHGIPQVDTSDIISDPGRISVIAWGWTQIKN
jgi:hypothetical protein